MDIDDFWSKIKFLIKSHKTTQENIARLIGIPFNTFRNWMHEGRSPDIQTVVNLSIVLGVTLDYLVFDTEWSSTEEQQKRLLERKEAAAEITVLANQILKQSSQI